MIKRSRKTSYAEDQVLENTENHDQIRDPQVLARENEVLRRENEHMRRDLELYKRKIQELEVRNKFMDNQIWDLRKLVKRVGREGFLQITEVEREKKKLEEDYDSLKLVHTCLEHNSETIERCIAYWRDVINDQEN